MKNDLAQSTSTNDAQFGLLELFYVITVCAVGLIVSPWTILWSTVGLLFWWLQKRRKLNTVAGWVLPLIALFSLLFVVAVTTTKVRVSNRSSTMSHITGWRLMSAIFNWESVRKKFPSAYSLDAKGNPKLSWRVYLLPYMGRQALYAQFDLDQPWDGPANKKLLNQMPPFLAGYGKKTIPGHTPYKLVVDEGTVFEPGRSMNYGDLLDGSSNTVGIVEDAMNPVPWTKPEDLTVDQAIAVLAPKNPQDVAHVCTGRHGTVYGGSVVAMMDCTTHLISPGNDPETIRGWCLVDDGLVFEAPDHRAIFRVAQRQYYFSVGLYLFLLVLPGLILVFRHLADEGENAESSTGDTIEHG